MLLPVTTTTADHHESGAASVRDARLAPTLTIVHHAAPETVGARRVVSEAVELGRESAYFGDGALANQLISRRHLRLVPEGFSLRVEDLESRNGTLVNGAELRGSAHVEPGSVIELGPLMLLYHLAPAVSTRLDHPRFVGKSNALANVLEEVSRVAPHASTVLVLGETGTGKELVARELHLASGRPGELVAANCGTLTDSLLQSELFGYERGAFSGAMTARMGLFEAAEKGTLLLDEVGDASPALQVALLRVLQEREVRRIGATRSKRVDARVVAATHRDLRALVAAGTFREDLFARLSQWTLRVPPLRERREDIPWLVASILKRFGEERPLHRSAMRSLLLAPLPRNVRQLEAIVERIARTARPDERELRLTREAALVLGLEATDEGRPARATRGATAGKHASAAASPALALGSDIKHDAEGLVHLLKQHRGNVTHLARELSIGRNTLYRWLKEAGVDVDVSRRDGD